MLKIYSLLGVITALCLQTALGGNAPAPVTVKSEDTRIEGYVSFQAPVSLPATSAGDQATLEFTAWYKADDFKGYSAGMQVFWDGTELTKALNRPDTFQMNDGRSIDTRSKVAWAVPILNSPESMKSQKDSKYYVSPEKADVLHFRFAVPDSGAGKHVIRIVNTSKAGTAPALVLMVRDIRVTFSPK